MQYKSYLTLLLRTSLFLRRTGNEGGVLDVLDISRIHNVKTLNLTSGTRIIGCTYLISEDVYCVYWTQKKFAIAPFHGNGVATDTKPTGSKFLYKLAQILKNILGKYGDIEIYI